VILCAHCGRRCAGFVTHQGKPLCYPDNPALPCCYRRVRELAEPLGALKAVHPKPPGVIPLDQDRAWREMMQLGEETGS